MSVLQAYINQYCPLQFEIDGATAYISGDISALIAHNLEDEDYNVYVLVENKDRERFLMFMEDLREHKDRTIMGYVVSRKAYTLDTDGCYVDSISLTSF